MVWVQDWAWASLGWGYPGYAYDMDYGWPYSGYGYYGWGYPTFAYPSYAYWGKLTERAARMRNADHDEANASRASGSRRQQQAWLG
jgi:hypothetical protein